MRENKLVARQKRRFKRTTDSEHAWPVAPNLIDQDFNMARVVDLGLGFVVPERRFRTETLRAAIDEVLGEERYRARAREASAAVAEFDAPQTAAQLIADLAEAAGAAAARPDGAGDRRAHRESD
jgi:hypothetical protein